jgi:MFS family permease
MLTALRQRNFALLWIGQLISILGDWVLFVALPFYVYDLTGSVLATGAMFMVQTLPRLLLGSLAGVFVDRWDRKRTMVIAELLQAFVLLPLLLVRSRESVWLVYIFALVEVTIAQFFLPAKNAIIPNLVGEEHLTEANSLNWLSENVARLIGPLLGGALLAAFGLTGVVLADSLSFLISAALIALIALAPAPSGERAAADLRPPSDWRSALIAVWREWTGGLRLVRQDRLIVGLFITFGIVMVWEGIIISLLVPFVSGVLGGGEIEFGWLMSAQAAGGLLGAFIIPRAAKVIAPSRLIALSGVILGLLILALTTTRSIPVAMGLFVLAGIALIGFFVTSMTMAQNSTADEYRGRVFGVFNTTNALMTLVGMGLASGLADLVGVLPIIGLGGLLYFVAAGVALVMLRAPADGIKLVHQQERVAQP